MIISCIYTDTCSVTPKRDKINQNHLGNPSLDMRPFDIRHLFYSSNNCVKDFT